MKILRKPGRSGTLLESQISELETGGKPGLHNLTLKKKIVKELAQGHSLSFCPPPMHTEMPLSNSHEASCS